MENVFKCMIMNNFSKKIAWIFQKILPLRSILKSSFSYEC